MIGAEARSLSFKSQAASRAWSKARVARSGSKRTHALNEPVVLPLFLGLATRFLVLDEPSEYDSYGQRDNKCLDRVIRNRFLQ